MLDAVVEIRTLEVQTCLACLTREDSPKLVLRVKRRKTLVLTPQGRALMRRAAPAIERMSERLLAPLNPNDRKTFVGFLLRLAGDLNESSRSPVTAPGEDSRTS